MNKKTIITDSLSDKQFEIINNLFDSTATYNVLNSGRQSGKTYTMSRLALILAAYVNNAKVLVAAPYNTQSDTFFYNVMQIPGIDDVVERSIQSPYKSITLKNGSVIDFRSVDNPKSIRSKSYNYIFLDEFAFFKDGAFDLAIVPTLIASGDNCKLFFSSTPNGNSGQFFEMAEAGQSDDPDYSYNYMNYEDNPNKNLSIIESERLRMPPNRFKQEFLGEFISSGGDVFEDIRSVMTLTRFEEFNSKQRYFAGIDFGRASDATVLTILDNNKNAISITEHKGDWASQVKGLGAILNIYKPIVYAESNGIGDPVIEQLKGQYTNVRSFVTSNSSKKEIVEKLKMDILLKVISLPSPKLCPKLDKELGNYTYSMTKTGLITYHHRDGEHDDYVDSLAMANYAYNKHNVGFKAMGGRYNKFHS